WAGFGELLRGYRAAAGLTQVELAERAGLSARGVADLEGGARVAPYPRTVRQLARALGLGESERAVLLAARGVARAAIRATAADALGRVGLARAVPGRPPRRPAGRSTRAGGPLPAAP